MPAAGNTADADADADAPSGRLNDEPAGAVVLAERAYGTGAVRADAVNLTRLVNLGAHHNRTNRAPA